MVHILYHHRRVDLGTLAAKVSLSKMNSYVAAQDIPDPLPVIVKPLPQALSGSSAQMFQVVTQ